MISGCYVLSVETIIYSHHFDSAYKPVACTKEETKLSVPLSLAIHNEV